jgi:hypothetical protein
MERSRWLTRATVPLRTREQTFGDAIRREFVKWEYGPMVGDHQVVVTWRDPDGEQEDYETRSALAEKVDVVVGTAELAVIVENPFLGLSPAKRQLLTCALAGNYPPDLEHLRYDVIKMLARADFAAAQSEKANHAG